MPCSFQAMVRMGDVEKGLQAPAGCDKHFTCDIKHAKYLQDVYKDAQTSAASGKSTHAELLLSCTMYNVM